MNEMKQCTLRLLRELRLWAFVGLCCVWALVGLCCIGLAVEAWRMQQLGRAAIAGATAKANAAIDDLGPRLDAGIQASSARLGRSLDNVDRQVATVGPVVRKLGPALDNLA